jgi:hypothetical protein
MTFLLSPGVFEQEKYDDDKGKKLWMGDYENKCIRCREE